MWKKSIAICLGLLKIVPLPLARFCAVPLNPAAVPLCIFACFLVSCFCFLTSSLNISFLSSPFHAQPAFTETVLGCTCCCSCSLISLLPVTSELIITYGTTILSFLLTKLSQVFGCIPFSQLQLGCFKNKALDHMLLFILILGTFSKFCPALFCEILHCSGAFSSIVVCFASLWCVFHDF